MSGLKPIHVIGHGATLKPLAYQIAIDITELDHAFGPLRLPRGEHLAQGDGERLGLALPAGLAADEAAVVTGEDHRLGS